jgi:mannitol-1-phosphate 5-dehydrogenase
VIARAVVQRAKSLLPLNMLCCENQKEAGAILRAAVAEHLPQDIAVRQYFDDHVAFVDASVGRMVPPPTPELLAEDPLLILAEPYSELPIDGSAWIGPVPPIPGLLPKTNFAGYVARKLFTHNGGHALLAYEGYQRGHEFIWQAAEDPELVAQLRGYWDEVGEALIRAFGFPAGEQRAHEADLLQRFRNRALGDTVARVGRDIARKVRPDDRLVGAALLCATQKIEPTFASRAIAAAYAYSAPEDPTAPQIQQATRTNGIRAALSRYSQIEPDTPLADRIASEYATIGTARP